jgi:hypothetical protein
MRLFLNSSTYTTFKAAITDTMVYKTNLVIRQVKQLPKVHRASKKWSWDLSSSLIPKPICFKPLRPN